MNLSKIKNDWLRRLILVVVFVPVMVLEILLSLTIELWKCFAAMPAEFIAAWMGEKRYWEWYYRKQTKGFE